ncbi:hypothetical protein ABE65_011500 [Fictibacillus phosphorivorans]|uniref:Uncharacterized protein n=1 Tax=Fictibacillus phosphorivorans TaxID=1221500 RepID=A0A160IP32_9BACL|nr:hypothetical protein [Fictibacillus phosphorivorans]ANC77392.1 hypothetical protein ABE65_011500 [Fictibacillus phosphorivorans]
MSDWLDKTIKYLLIVGLVIFIFIITIGFVNAIGKDYKYAIVGLLGSVIGGFLTLIGVWWTLKEQYKTNFLNDFPKKIRSFDELKQKIKNINSETFFLESELHSANLDKMYDQLLEDLRMLTVDLDGSSYFIVNKLDGLFKAYKKEKREVSSYFLTGPNNYPMLTEESKREIKKIQEKYDLIILNITNDLEEHGKVLLNQYFKYKE